MASDPTQTTEDVAPLDTRGVLVVIALALTAVGAIVGTLYLLGAYG